MTKREIKKLKAKYERHLALSKGGCLEKPQRERLLDLLRGDKNDIRSEAERRKEETDFWHRIKNTARAALVDLAMISEIGDEKLLREIFHEVESSINLSPLAALLESLFPKDSKDITEEGEWRSKLLADSTRNGLEWYVNRRVFQTEVSQRAIFDVLDMLSVMQHGKKIYKAERDELGNLIIEKPRDYMPSVGDKTDDDE